MSLENGESQADEQPKDDEPVPAEEPRGGLIGAMQRRLGPSVTSALMLGVFVVVGAALFVLVVVGINRWMTGDQEGAGADTATQYPKSPPNRAGTSLRE